MADTGYGITISFESGFLAEIIDVTPNEIQRDEIETSHTTTPDNARTYIMQDLVNYGELGCDLNFDPGAVPPITNDFSPVVITFDTGETWSFSGALKSYAPTAPIDDRMTASVVIKCSGKITFA